MIHLTEPSNNFELIYKNIEETEEEKRISKIIWDKKVRKSKINKIKKIITIVLFLFILLLVILFFSFLLTIYNLPNNMGILVGLMLVMPTIMSIDYINEYFETNPNNIKI